MDKDTSCRRVFVIGKHRSGTTWVTNIVAAHPEFFTPEHEIHKGQHESAFFSSLVPYCRSGVSEVDKRAIVAIFERTDFWKLLFPNNPPNFDIKELGVYGYFAAAMDAAAIRRGCTSWVEKTPAHTLYLKDLLSRYPDAKFVAVERSRVDVVRSNVHKFGDASRSFDWLKAAFAGEIYSKIINHYKDQLHIVRYEALVSNYDAEYSRLFEYLGVKLSKDGVRSRWAPDSSFGKVPPQLSLKQRVIVKVVQSIFIIVPPSWCNCLIGLRKRYKRGVLPRWLFRVFKGGRDDVKK